MANAELIARIDRHLASAAAASQIEDTDSAAAAKLTAAMLAAYGVDLQPSDFSDLARDDAGDCVFSVEVGGIRFAARSDFNEGGAWPEYAILVDAAGCMIGLASLRAILAGHRNV